MDQETSPSGTSSGEPPQQQKRSRVLLSCGPCRYSKLKCDREQPCSQCAKKGREDLCVYAPKPERKRPAKGMATRLKRLEGMVREMIDNEGTSKPQAQSNEAALGPPVTARVLQGANATTYVGATHCMAMLEDIEDLKSYFDEPEEPEDGGSPYQGFETSDILLLSRRGPKNRQDLLNQIPGRNVADRLITRYLSLMSPSQHIVHRLAFTRAYAKFWQNPDEAHLHWVAQLFMMLSLGVFFNSFVNASELEGDSPMAPEDRIRHYKQCAGWALALGKFSQPCQATLPAFLLYVESDFILNRAAQMNCYLLSGVCIRLMLKMGLHRDPGKLANISPFEAEMRRRMWNMALQIDLLVSFHMGLPSMLQGIETDTTIPRNLQDDDFDEDSVELPPGRPSTEHTSMTYPIWKTEIIKVFGQIARQAHALTPPSYQEVMKLDNLLEETWKRIPAFMKFRPLEECIGDPPMLLIQRFGLGALYSKSRCVLHRRYLVEAVPKSEHDYSRKQCLDGALTLLNYQHLIWEACKPGHVLSQYGWFTSSLAVHDYLLGAMCVYLVVKNENYSEFGGDYNWMTQQTPTPAKEELKDMLKRSHSIWSEVATNVGEVKKTADTLAIMLARIGRPVNTATAATDSTSYPQTVGSSAGSSSFEASSIDAGLLNDGPVTADVLSSLGLDGSTSGPDSGQSPFSVPQTADASTGMSFPDMGTTANAISTDMSFDPSWMEAAGTMDWRYLDVSLAHSHDAGRNPDTGRTWMERPSLDDLDIMASWPPLSPPPNGP